jgi:hypothetical protein
VSSTSKTMTIASGRAASFNLSRENELKVRRCWPLDSGLANRPRTKIRPFEVNLMLFPIKLVKTCMMRAESPMTFLGTSSATIGAIHFRTHSPNSFPHHSQPKNLPLLSVMRKHTVLIQQGRLHMAPYITKFKRNGLHLKTASERKIHSVDWDHKAINTLHLERNNSGVSPAR